MGDFWPICCSTPRLSLTGNTGTGSTSDKRSLHRQMAAQRESHSHWTVTSYQQCLPLLNLLANPGRASLKKINIKNGGLEDLL